MQSRFDGHGRLRQLRVPEYRGTLPRLQLFLGASHSVLRWISGLVLLSCSLILCLLLLYFTSKVSWKLKTLIDDWMH